MPLTIKMAIAAFLIMLVLYSANRLTHAAGVLGMFSKPGIRRTEENNPTVFVE